MHWTTFDGPRSAEVLNGLVSNDTTRLAPGAGHYAAALTPKGKVLADLVVLRLADDRFLVGSSPAAHPGWWDMIRKYVNPRLARYADASPGITTRLVAGDRAADTVAQLLDGAAAPDSAWRHAAIVRGGAETRAVRVPWYGALPAWLLLAPADAADALRARLAALDVAEVTLASLEPDRIAAGWPRWGVDMTDATIPQEANLDVLGAIAFDKGCYTGQETVARVHFRGHVNRHLRGLRSDAPLTTGAVLRDGTGKEVGDVRSVAVSPSLGPIALAMVRREVPPGSVVQVDGASAATVVALPFGTGAEAPDSPEALGPGLPQG
jgi:folate-binding protein YgfZ